MKVVVNGKQIDVGDALRTYVIDQLQTNLAKYFDDKRLEANVTFSRQAHLFRADCAVHAGSEIYLQSHGEANDIYAAFAAAGDRLEKRLRRYKRRLRDHHKRRLESEAAQWRAATMVLEPDVADEEPEYHVDGWQPIVVAETTMEILQLSVGEAVMRMDLAEAAVFMFRNSSNGQFNVIFRRQDGNIGWVDPANIKTGS
ncbi:ribosome hibernation-promoting factor, HPF/YfiA family [Govanella unica]|uniref:Ribosome hibernation promoting factor n=1 Tax=Govanella unica TaxID=2975056 RepID=A0A9X3Z6E5_9PROT|nr:ribosome-associated translation inhibitor RaiA [Govania unica]MDA5192992.1 ribosome-associated translation inhibitor RaiA [Govania unica]